MGRTIRRRRSNSSLSEAISVSLGINQDSSVNKMHRASVSAMSPPLCRSYMSGFFTGGNSPMINNLSDSKLPISNKQHPKVIHGSENLHRQTAQLSNEFCSSSVEENSPTIKDYMDIIGNGDRKDDQSMRTIEENIDEEYSDEYSRLLLSPASSNVDDDRNRGLQNSSLPELEDGYAGGYQSLRPSHNLRFRPRNLWHMCTSFPSKFAHYLPAAVLGLLLNILDALSYGMIIFPITEPVFSHLGPTGISMFYISTIISQAVYSGGWSSFPSGIGSEMIEITPFYHTMALAIKEALAGNDDEIITTAIFCYVISSMLTGVVFYALGKLRLGKIVGFFPRHILIGCIGGVGYFLIITGIEVTTRVAKFEYSWPFFSGLFTDYETLAKWLLPVLLTVVLIGTQRYFKNSLVLPSFYILTLVLFHFIVAIIPTLSLDALRQAGWIFPIANSDSKWYDHYRLFNVHKVHWSLVLQQIPTMMALTFFGILHVPINVPALAMSLQMDKYDVDRELIAHGYSNFFSGLLGSVQNYLVYTNSVLFIRAGADSPFAGFLLIALTICIMIIGPVIISFIPICIVGSLIFLLGYELLVEALVDTWNKLNRFEYLTVVIIVFTMGIFDFVLGIIVGILIACFSFLVDSTKLQTINGEYNGNVARSTVYRDYVQTKFLDGIGEQIYVLKLQNLLFFGTIISIEEKIERLLQISNKDATKRRIKYLILDFKNINADNIDYSAAEGFNRIKRFTETKRIKLIISSIKERDRIYNAFNNVGLLNDVELFADLNSALEWCENEFLFQYKQLRKKAKERLEERKQNNVVSAVIAATKNKKIDTIGNGLNRGSNGDTARNLMSLPTNTPRNYQILSVAQNVFVNDEQAVKNFKKEYKDDEPVLPILLFALKQYRPDIISEVQKVREKEIKFWAQLCPYFTRRRLASQSHLLHADNIFFLVETGMLKATYELPQGTLYEIFSNGTCFGKIIAPGNAMPREQKLTIETETDSVLWVIDSSSLNKLKEDNLALYVEVALMVMCIKDTRFKELLGYTLVSA
ncbi:ASN_HP2_G0020440.mRNA.1.CDS.1 [Saccharomyces cerevisiae]|nr:BGN_3a_G0021000.mRNA.1.CDS.1 [Saccharomyces cerevisiae]CAI5274159.1 ASN_HP2_G0020440.mRNA.1.CDS.1 [Saccharomyces cerevisiae]CAI6520557.1 ASN_HP2_G0020440.mRNA.1.CDS.1 [Saccharomyces cerevisiae]CAI6524791.1 ASN_HP1_G0021010.mRNA.1.CDS.1 [Saccharomyces cerevisiae]CAI7126946.1 BGN_3a_G0021000.mRNA.1.CDS.1 [Saccharomyces cerevisiae]